MRRRNPALAFLALVALAGCEAPNLESTEGGYAGPGPADTATVSASHAPAGADTSLEAAVPDTSDLGIQPADTLPAGEAH